MKTVLLCPYYFPDMIGGMEWYAYHISTELAKLGVNITVLTQRSSKTQKSHELIKGVKVRRFDGIGIAHRAKFWLGLNKALKEINPDVIHSIDYSRSYTWSALMFGLKNKIPTAITISDIVSQKKPRPIVLQIPLEIFDKFFAKLILKNAQKLLLRTKWTSKWVLEKGLSKDVIEITPSGLSEEELRKGNAKKFEKKFGISKKIILFLGTIRKQKGPMLLLEAFENVKKKVPDAKLVFVGSPQIDHEKLRFVPLLEQKIKEKNIFDVYFLGQLFGEDKINALAACDVMALPSSFENFGQVYPQAMAQAKPVIGTTGGGIPEIVEHNKDGFLIKPWDKNDLEQKLLLLLTDKNLRKKFGQKGKKKAKKYQYKILAKELVKIYESMQKNSNQEHA